MIPQAHITAWRTQAPWPDDAQVEQDLVLTRAAIELFASPDLVGNGLEANFNLVSKRFGQTVHVHELESKDYPYAKLFELLVKLKYEGWVLLEAASKRDDYVAALAEQKQLFDRLLKGAGDKR